MNLKIVTEIRALGKENKVREGEIARDDLIVGLLLNAKLIL